MVVSHLNYWTSAPWFLVLLRFICIRKLSENVRKYGRIEHRVRAEGSVSVSNVEPLFEWTVSHFDKKKR